MKAFSYVICIAFLALCLTSCVGVSYRTDNGRVVAAVGDKLLRVGELTATVPSGLTGVDSIGFVSSYVDKWIARQVKVCEAERIFASSVEEIDAMVESYRQALLTRKLDQYYINSSREMPFTQSDVEAYYEQNPNNFLLEEPIVKGRILQMPNESGEKKVMLALMRSDKSDRRLNLVSICEKSSEFDYREFESWIDYGDFIDMLPVVQGSDSEDYLKRRGVQSLQDSLSTYLFEVTAYRTKGYVAPLERVEGVIRRLLTSQYHNELISEREEQLFLRAEKGGKIRNFVGGIAGQDSEEVGGDRDNLYPALVGREKRE